MSNAPPSCVINALVQIVVTILENSHLIPDEPAITDGLMRSKNAFESNLPQESQSTIFGEALACAGSSTVDLESEATDLYASFVVALVVAVIVCVCISVVVASPEIDLVKVVYVIVLIVLLIVCILVILDRGERIIGLSECVRDTVRREEVNKEQYFRALNSALCAY